MADFLKLNRYTIPIKDGSVEMSETMIGETERGFSGEMRSTRRAFKRRWGMETTVLSNRTAYTVRKILEGQGFNIPFRTDLYSTNGLNPEPAYDLVFNVGGGPAGSNSVTLNSGTLRYNAFINADPNGWTVMVDKKVSGVWTRYAKDVIGQVYVNGVLSFSDPASWLTAPTGVVILTHGTGNTDFANLVLLPWVIDEAYAVDWGDPLTSKLFPDLPRLTMAGDIVLPNETITGYGILDSESPVQSMLPGDTFRANNVSINFTIDEA